MNSKLEIRFEAVKMAAGINGVKAQDVIRVAKRIERYILGDADLPEVYDSNALYKDMLNTLHESVQRPAFDTDFMEKFKAVCCKETDEAVGE